MVSLKFKKLNSKVVLPKYQTEHSAGMDIRAFIEKPIILKPMQRTLIPCGFSIEIPIGYEVQIRARSGLALKNGVCLANGIGTIDADYRGELGVILINLGSDNFVIKNGDRIAQMVLCKYERAKLLESKNLKKSERGKGGFGSTGV